MKSRAKINKTIKEETNIGFRIESNRIGTNIIIIIIITISTIRIVDMKGNFINFNNI